MPDLTLRAHKNHSDLKAVLVNSTLKSTSQGQSHTAQLMKNAAAILRKHGVSVYEIRAAGHWIAFGV